MQTSLNADELQETLRAELELLDGVARVFIEGPPWNVSLVCTQAVANPAEVEIAARAMMAKAGFTADEVVLQLSFLAPPPKRHRVRFVRTALAAQSAAHAAATVTLEWGDTVVEGRAEGDASPVGVLRLCATATIEALERLLDRQLCFQLVGIKSVRVFDGDLMVVLLRTDHLPHRQLIGAVLVSADPCDAAAIAVLNATNRLLGNYVQTNEGGEP